MRTQVSPPGAVPRSSGAGGSRLSMRRGRRQRPPDGADPSGVAGIEPGAPPRAQTAPASRGRRAPDHPRERHLSGLTQPRRPLLFWGTAIVHLAVLAQRPDADRRRRLQHAGPKCSGARSRARQTHSRSLDLSTLNPLAAPPKAAWRLHRTRREVRAASPKRPQPAGAVTCWSQVSVATMQGEGNPLRSRHAGGGRSRKLE